MKLSVLAILLFITPLFACAEGGKQTKIRMATTTSTDNTGLLKAILPAFENKTGFKVQVVAVGTGKALKMGRDGDVDVVLVHARKAEEAFVANGFGTKRHDVMYNQFIIIGPKHDPADVKQAKSAPDALNKILQKKSKFVSRGDDSGTHKKEQGLWNLVGKSPVGNWYLEAGQGMGKIIQIAGELDAYTLTDSGTWLVHKDKSPLKEHFESDEALFNPYGIIGINPKKHTQINIEGANSLIQWITSEEGQTLIGNYRFRDQQLFVPNALTNK